MQVPLRAHLLLLVVVLVIPLAGLLGWGAWRDAQYAVDQVRAVHRPIATLLAADVGRKIVVARDTLARLAQRPLIQAADPTRCDPLLAELLSLSSGFANIILTNTEGLTLCSALPLPPGPVVNVGQTPWFRQLMVSKQFQVGQAHMGPVSRKWVAVLSMPVRNAEGDMVAAVHLTLNLVVLNPGIAAHDLPPHSSFGIIDSQGTLLWRNQDSEKAIGTRPQWEVVRRILAHQNTHRQAEQSFDDEADFETVGLDGVMRFYTSSPIPEAGWTAYFGQPSAGVYTQAHERIATSVTLGLISVVLLGVFVLVVAGRIERPIRSMAQTVGRFSAGEKHARATASGPTELVQLAHALNHLLEERLHTETTLNAQHHALQEAKNRIDLAMQIAQMGMWTWDMSAGTLHADDILARLFGYEPHELRVTPIVQWRERTDSNDLAALDERLRACLKGESIEFALDQRIRHRQGHWIWGQWRGRVTERDAQGRALIMMGSFIDVTARMKEREQLQLAASVFTHAREGIIITERDGTIIDVNDTFTHITGYSRAEAIGNNPRMLQCPQYEHQTLELYDDIAQNLQSHGHWTGEMWNQRKNGTLFARMVTVSAVRNAQGHIQHYVSLFTDITALKEHERKLEHIAHYDALTGLPNRVLLADRLQQSMLRCQRKGLSLAVAFLDLDGFKSINDRYSHELGDRFLVALAHRLKASLREGDTLSRLGGDEFVAVLVDLECPQDCEPVLLRMLQAAAQAVPLDEYLLQVSASIGVTLYPADGSAPDLLLRHADQAMYQAKQLGKNRFYLFDIARDLAVTTQREEIARIRQGLQAQEFVLYYQPKVNMRTGAVIGAEALIRWQHPERGLLSPAAFLPAIENHPICIDLGEWVIRSALGQMTTWKAQALDISVSVNIDAMQLQKEGFSQRLAELLALYPQIQPHKLELEILETNALEDISLVSEIMRHCQALGVRFALDDFGTGYSSLTYLKRLGAEVIKIDQSFVRDMLVDRDDLAIVQGVIGLANAFHRDVIAEGVETLEHGTRLLRLGCYLAQGYGIAKPMPAALFPDWAQNWHPAPQWQQQP